MNTSSFSFDLQRFEYSPTELLLRLELRTTVDVRVPCPAALIMQRPSGGSEYRPLLSCSTPVTKPHADGVGGAVGYEAGAEWSWRGAFAVPHDAARDPLALFALRLREELLPLPAPRELGRAGELAVRKAPTGPRRGRRRTLAVLAGCQICLAAAYVAPAALGDGPTPATATSAPAGAEEGAPSPPPPPSVVAGTSTTRAAPAGEPSAPPAPEDSQPAVAVASPQRASASPQRGPAERTHRAARVTSKAPQQAAEEAAAAAKDEVALAPGLVAAQAKAFAAQMASSEASNQALAFYRIPLFLLPIYQAAAAQYGVPWQILAAINEVETDYGEDLSVSSAGAVGWMQFMPATWLQYGVDALNAGYADPYNPVDAIFAAARYLSAAGAQNDLRVAILAYNHSDAYASSVLLRAKLIAAYPATVMSTLAGLADGRPPVRGHGVSWSPLAHPSKIDRKRRLIDVQSAPGATVVAVQDGRIIHTGASRTLGRYIVMRDVYGDVFTYAGLGSVAATYPAAKTSNARSSAYTQTEVTADATLVRLRSLDPHARLGAKPRAQAAAVRPHLLALRRGALVRAGVVLGHVGRPPGTRRGHLLFSIQPAGDAQTIAPAAVLRGWAQLLAALHPQGAAAEQVLVGLGPAGKRGAGRATGTPHAAGVPANGRAAEARRPTTSGARPPLAVSLGDQRAQGRGTL